MTERYTYSGGFDGEEETFETDPDFCKTCGSILLVRGGNQGGGGTDSGRSGDDFGVEKCMVCLTPVIRKQITEITYTVHFNNKNVYTKGASGDGDDDKADPSANQKKKSKSEAEGPLVDRDCRECGHKQMSYATLQLRSADEGQTVFYTCPKCKFKESENS